MHGLQHLRTASSSGYSLTENCLWMPESSETLHNTQTTVHKTFKMLSLNTFMCTKTHVKKPQGMDHGKWIVAMWTHVLFSILFPCLSMKADGDIGPPACPSLVLNLSSILLIWYPPSVDRYPKKLQLDPSTHLQAFVYFSHLTISYHD